jgi:cold shock CspA family protein
VSTRDRNFRPSRRRSFDDDNYQPPTRDFGFASRPSVLRFETPSGPPVRAIVKWYNPDKGFGFVELPDGYGDAFLHVSVVERNGGSSVLPGATLEVRAGPGPKGPQVTEILSVDTSTLSQVARHAVHEVGPDAVEVVQVFVDHGHIQVGPPGQQLGGPNILAGFVHDVRILRPVPDRLAQHGGHDTVGSPLH